MPINVPSLPGAAPIVMKIEITMDASGNVAVAGHIDNKVLAYGLLDVAKEVVNTYVTSQQKKVQPANLADVLAINGGKKHD